MFDEDCEAFGVVLQALAYTLFVFLPLLGLFNPYLLFDIVQALRVEMHLHPIVFWCTAFEVIVGCYIMALWHIRYR